MNNWLQYIPHAAHTIVWMFAAVLIIIRLNSVANAILGAISEKKPDGTRGEVSIKRIIPFIFTLVICYMVVGCMHNEKKEFNSTAFWGLMLYVALATTVISVSQAFGFFDRISILRGKVTETSIENKSKDHSSDNP